MRENEKQKETECSKMKEETVELKGKRSNTGLKIELNRVKGNIWSFEHAEVITAKKLADVGDETEISRAFQ